MNRCTIVYLASLLESSLVLIRGFVSCARVNQVAAKKLHHRRIQIKTSVLSLLLFFQANILLASHEPQWFLLGGKGDESVCGYPPMED